MTPEQRTQIRRLQARMEELAMISRQADRDYGDARAKLEDYLNDLVDEPKVEVPVLNSDGRPFEPGECRS